MSDTPYNPDDKGQLFNQNPHTTFSEITDAMRDRAEEIQQEIIREARQKLLE